MKKECSFKKNVLIFYKPFFYKNGKVKTMPVVASRLVVDYLSNSIISLYSWLGQAAACDGWSTPLITIDKTRARRDMLEDIRRYSKIKLTKLSLNNLPDKFPPPSFL